MATRATIIPLKTSQTGLTLSAQLVNTDGSSNGSAVTSGFAELGNGFYLWTYSGFPSQFRGGVVISNEGVILAALAINPEELENVDETISSRSTFAGGAVASVTAPVAIVWGANAPVGWLDAAAFASEALAGQAVLSVVDGVTVATNGDKTGYSLASAGLDAIEIETGINARQALSPILSLAAGVLSGAGTDTIVLYAGGNPSTTRISATIDGSNNRTAVTLTLPD